MYQNKHVWTELLKLTQNKNKCHRNYANISDRGGQIGGEGHDDVMNLVRNGTQGTEFPIECYNYFTQQVSTEYFLHVSVSARVSMMNNNNKKAWILESNCCDFNPSSVVYQL